MGEYLLQLVWFFLPAGLANMAAAFCRRLPFLDYPVDFGRTYRGRAIFGPHKTWRGLVFGMLAAILGVYLQKIFYPNTASLALINYQTTNICLVGALLGIGALGGDLVRSFIKRRKGIAPGRPWFPWDQLDWIVGANILIYFYYQLPLPMIILSLLIALIIHPAVNYLCYISGLQHNKF